MKFLTTSLVALVLAIPSAVIAADLAELTAQCDSCHGPQGASSDSDMPIIGGQSEQYISKTLNSYQVWGRPCIKSKYRHGDTSKPRTDMCKVSGGLTQEDIAALSAHYGALPFVAAKQEFDPAKAAAGRAMHDQYCDSCHEQGGKAAGIGPRLAGQWTLYLKSALKFVPTGEHLVPPKMERTVVDMSADQLDALMNFYASQQD